MYIYIYIYTFYFYLFVFRNAHVLYKPIEIQESEVIRIDASKVKLTAFHFGFNIFIHVLTLKNIRKM